MVPERWARGACHPAGVVRVASRLTDRAATLPARAYDENAHRLSVSRAHLLEFDCPKVIQRHVTFLSTSHVTNYQLLGIEANDQGVARLLRNRPKLLGQGSCRPVHQDVDVSGSESARDLKPEGTVRFPAYNCHDGRRNAPGRVARTRDRRSCSLHADSESDARRGPAPEQLDKSVVPPASPYCILLPSSPDLKELERGSCVVVQAANEPMVEFPGDCQSVKALLHCLKVDGTVITQVIDRSGCGLDDRFGQVLVVENAKGIVSHTPLRRWGQARHSRLEEPNKCGTIFGPALRVPDAVHMDNDFDGEFAEEPVSQAD